jgi:hypothetical protein
MEEYLELLFGDKFDKSCFDFGKAVDNVGVTYDNYIQRLNNSTGFKCDIDEDKMYYFMLYNCYNIYAYPIKVICSPSLYIWFKVKYHPEDLLGVDFKSKCFGKIIPSRLDLSYSHDKMMLNCIVDTLKSMSIEDFVRQGKIDYEIVNAKDYLLKAHKRDYISILIYRLSKLFFLIDKRQKGESIEKVDFDYKLINKDQRNDIVKIMIAFGLWNPSATNNDFLKVLAANLSGEMLDRDKYYLTSGSNTTLYSVPDEMVQKLIVV